MLDPQRKNDQLNLTLHIRKPCNGWHPGLLKGWVFWMEDTGFWINCLNEGLRSSSAELEELG